MSDRVKVSDVEMYVFDDIDSREIDLQEIDGKFGDLQVNGSILEHTKIEENEDYKVRTVSQIMLRKVSTTKRFRYTTRSSKPDGLGIILRSENHDFVFTSTNQEMSDIDKEIKNSL